MKHRTGHFRIFKRVIKIYRRSLKGKRSDYLKYKETARILVKNRIDYFNKIYNFKVNRVTIKNQRSRWGSCSKKGNLNFNYKIALLPSSLADYVIVHELCHLKEFNHSKNFWDLVKISVPNYKEIRRKFRQPNTNFN